MPIYGPVTYDWEGQTYTQYGVYAGNAYDAAMYALGYASDTINGLDLVSRSKLSNASTGGKFFEFVQLWSNPPTDGYGLNNPGFWSTAYGVYGEGHVWYAEYTKSLAASAKEDLDVILNGGSLGDGDTGSLPEHDGGNHVVTWARKLNKAGDSGTMKLFDSLAQVPEGTSTGTAAQTVYDQMPDTMQLAIWDVSYNKMIEWTRDYDVVFSAGLFANRYGCLQEGKYYVVERGGYDLEVVDGTAKLVVHAGSRCVNYNALTWLYRDGNGGVGLEYGANPSVTSIDNDMRVMANGYTYNLYNAYAVFSNLHNTLFDEPVTPPTNNWPETPTPSTPEPPELHEPATAPTYPQQVTYNEPTYIEADLSAILDALNEHCVHLQDAIYAGLSNLYDSLAGYMSGEMYLLRSEMYEELSWIYDGLDSHDAHVQFDFERVLMALRNLDTSPDIDLDPVLGAIANLETYLDEILSAITNIADEDTDQPLIRGYLKGIYDLLTDWPEPVATDLTTIESLLRDILAKDISPDVTVEPTPVAVEPTDLDPVLVELRKIEELLKGTGVKAPVADPGESDPEVTIGQRIGEKMDQLKDRFPFSLPWDIFAILNLLRAEPVAPRFDLPVIGSEESVHVDLSGWESVAVVTRGGTTLLFALGLALRSRSLLASWGGVSGD